MEEQKRRSGQIGVPFFDATLSSFEIAAHELKSPLALIRQLTIELKSTDIMDGERDMILTQIQLLSERSLRLSSDITKASSLQTSLFPNRPLNVSQLCEDVVDEMSPLYLAHDKTLTRRSVGVLPLAVANYDLLRRILLNFSDNALHYADQHGKVTMSSQHLRRRGIVRVSVRDFGPALPTHIWRSLRSAHVEMPKSIVARPNSSGLGIKISGQFADVIGGKIGAIKHRDGASFFIDLPVSKQLSLL